MNAFSHKRSRSVPRFGDTTGDLEVCSKLKTCEAEPAENNILSVYNNCGNNGTPSSFAHSCSHSKAATQYCTEDTQPLIFQIRGQFKQFCETTSLRGVPRIVSTKDTKRRLLWLIFVLAFFVGCITCLIFLINQYLAYDVIHQPKKLYDLPRSFPSVTICNLRPFSTKDIRKLKAAGVVPVDMYFDNIQRMIPQVRPENRRYMTMLWTMSAYLYNLPETLDESALGHSKHDIVKRCYIVYKRGTMNRGTDCESSGYWTKTRDPVFHNCYTYTIFQNLTNQVLNMEMVVYLDNLVEQTDCFDCQERVRASQLTGARLLLHPRASYPRVAEEGINLMPGTMTDIRFSVYEWSMMEPPHGRCSTSTPVSINFNHVNYSYSEEACHKHVRQLKVVQTCNCLTQSLPIPTELLDRKLNRCEAFRFPATIDLSDNFNMTKQSYFNDESIARLVQSSRCAEEILTKLDSSATGCRPACVRYTYRPSITAAQWPTKTFLTWFVTKFLKRITTATIRGRPHMTEAEQVRVQESLDELQELLSPYEEILNLTRAGKQAEAIQKLMSTEIFERNFLAIVISRPNFDVERVEEKAVVSLTSLFSQIGGLLSIWVGLTFVCIVELVELGLNVADTVLHHRRKRGK
ncbi:FMRFamide-activated amiloride-sensitive sodium channel [Clonorchis sinensis]|uniref:FMRFamide-activated amiloride-sensitive sodium channel n=2 Tax=Clonorchis sinensis TaxID=79923 RepID=G7YD97_CLOSI|nr:FMRFamide-activated amiloride-sensitive sodium channel [Clonorchis sinensis]GAA50931.1 FMRFamide-activated amiloride-sensitive sodium channel [Clonorchis sinensis]